MADEADDTKPMLELEAANVVLEQQPESVEDTPAKPEIATIADTDPAPTAPIQETSAVLPDPASSPVADGEIVWTVDGASNHVSRSTLNSTGTLGPKPVKPPRLKSMRSKESPPLLHARPVEETNDMEAAISGPTGDSIAVELKPYAPEEIQSYEPDVKPYEPEVRPYEPTTAPLLPTQQDAVKPKKKFGLDYIMNNKWIILGVVAITLIILIIIIVSVTVSRADPPKPPVPVVYDDPVVYNLKCGEAIGSWELNYSVAVFKGIPYLQPPVNEKRWSYDLEFKNAEDCVNMTKAKEFKGPCFQLNPTPGTNVSYKRIGSEDCLYMNIWTPSLAPDDATVKEQLPVMVYIHGGFLHFGSGHEDLFSPSAQLAEDLNSVIVSFNYRLNVFGWLALKTLESSKSLSGNYGLYDQIAALKWVKEYIVDFGGDPEKVTVAGLSSGGTSVLALLANTEARATFQRAWISGSSSKFDDDKLETYETNSKIYLRNVGCENVDTRSCLLSKTKEELIEAIPWIQYPAWAASELLMPPSIDSFIGAVLINDGKYVAVAPNKYFSTKTDLKMPLLIGTAEYETDRYQVVPVAQWSWGQYSDYIRGRIDTFNTSVSDYILHEYSPDLKTNPRLHMAKFVSDLRVNCPQTFIASDIKSKHPAASVYRYVMTAKVPQTLSDKYLGGSAVSTHGGDFAMLFHYSDDDSKEFRETKSRFRNLIKSFMVTGMLPNWEQFPTVYNISSESTNVTSRWTTGDCEKWKSFYPAYSWMN